MKRSLGIFTLLCLLAILLIAGCSSQSPANKVAVSTEPLDSADSLNIQPDPTASLDNQTLSTISDTTAAQDIFEDTV